MARDKVTITLDRAKAEDARALLGIATTSEVVDVGLDRLIHTERLRRDIAAYRRMPPSGEELGLATLGSTEGLEDDTDWEALYRDDEA